MGCTVNPWSKHQGKNKDKGDHEMERKEKDGEEKVIVRNKRENKERKQRKYQIIPKGYSI